MAILNSLPTKLGMATETSNGLMSAEDKILINKISKMELGNTDKDYDWTNNRLVLPKDIYLLANSQYSMYCQNMSVNKYTNNDYIQFEIGLPNGSILIENAFIVNSPITGDFKTRIVGSFKENDNCLFKDVDIHFNKANGKELSILCIGDDTVDMNMPGYINEYLTQLGYTPTMLGTQINSNTTNGYGIQIDEEFGEGYKGWRLTDFMCATKQKDGSPYYIQGNPFMNNNNKFDFSHYMTSNAYNKVDVVVLSMGLNDITGYHVNSEVQTLPISQNIQQIPALYKEMITSIHAFNPNIKIIINPTMTSGINDDFNKKSLLLTEALISELEGINNVFIVPGYITQPLYVSANVASTENYEEINNNKYGKAAASYSTNGVAQSNLAFMIVSTIVGITR